MNPVQNSDLHIDTTPSDGQDALEEPEELANETALLSEAAFAEDWDRPEEDAAWAYLSHHGCPAIEG